MDAWARDYKGRANFLCVGCAGEGLAAEFGAELKLQDCTNCFIDSEQGQPMPLYGQLGCNGFIVLDSKLRLVDGSTSAFQQVRDLAFRHVETLLDALLAKKTVMPWPCPGEILTLQNLSSSAKLNGQMVVCVASPAVDGDRATVQLRSGRNIKVLPTKLTGGSAISLPGG